MTNNPEEADYFYADAWIFWPHALNHMDDIVAEIRKKGPWFDRKNGSDHIFVITGKGRQGRIIDLELVQHVTYSGCEVWGFWQGILAGERTLIR